LDEKFILALFSWMKKAISILTKDGMSTNQLEHESSFFEHESPILYRIMSILEALPCFEVPSQRVLK
jgi:hypothetical protein